MTAAVSIQSSNAPIAQAELSKDEFAQIAAIATQISGIQLNESKLGLVRSRLQKRLRVLGQTDFREYIAFVKSPEGKAEVDELICAITTNVTAFNREPHHFEHFRNTVLPGLVAKMQRGEPVRIWSAGCSNGSEAYTIACSILGANAKAGEQNCRILASDIDKYSLEMGSKGIYPPDFLEKMPKDLVSKWFKENNGKFEIDARARALVSFKFLNLMEPWPVKRKYDAIFCRNTLIYFSAEDQSRIFSQFANHLIHGAHIYIGHSERVLGPATSTLIPVGTTTYRFDSGVG